MRRLIDIDYRRAACAFTPWETLRSLATAATCAVLVFGAVLSPRAVAADVIPVRFVAGAMHGFHVLRTVGDCILAIIWPEWRTRSFWLQARSPRCDPNPENRDSGKVKNERSVVS